MELHYKFHIFLFTHILNKIIFINNPSGRQPKYITNEFTLKNVLSTLLTAYGAGAESESGAYDYEETMVTRKCKFTDTGVTFGNAYAVNYSYVYNNTCVPYQIIGYEHL